MLTIFQKATPEALDEVREEMALRMTKYVILMITMGSQTDHLITLMLARLGIFCLVGDPATLTAADVHSLNPSGIVISGGPASVDSEPPPFDYNILTLGIPVFGICLGAQIISKHEGAIVRAATKREFSVEKLHVIHDSAIIDLTMEGSLVQQSHGDVIEKGDSQIDIIATTSNSAVAAFDCGHLHGVQFHPEVTETAMGATMLENFCIDECGITERFPAEDVAKKKISELKKKIGDADVVLALSAGCDSSVTAYLLKESMKDSAGTLHGIYIKGIDRPEDEAHFLKFFGNQRWIKTEIVDATKEFLAVLAGKKTMAEKREAVREAYRAVFETKVDELMISGKEKVFIAQGTIHTDITESGKGLATGARRGKLKQHHNVNLCFTVEELTPLDDQVKDTVRNIGRELGVPDALLMRHPFPGPGLVVRIIGEVTALNLPIARQADSIYIEELRAWNLYDKVWQAGIVVSDIVLACSKGDDGVEGLALLGWAVESVNGFTARPANLPFDFHTHLDKRLTNEIREVGGYFYRFTGKPPGTIEVG